MFSNAQRTCLEAYIGQLHIKACFPFIDDIINTIKKKKKIQKHSMSVPNIELWLLQVVSVLTTPGVQKVSAEPTKMHWSSSRQLVSLPFTRWGQWKAGRWCRRSEPPIVGYGCEKDYSEQSVSHAWWCPLYWLHQQEFLTLERDTCHCKRPGLWKNSFNSPR